MRIKLEIDVSPPAYSGEQLSYRDFPLDYQLRHQDLESNFALKIHALLCRGFLKGRDWYDFSWYVSKGVYPNLPHLKAAIHQFGPWAGADDIQVDSTWLFEKLSEVISRVDWSLAAEDVQRFLRPPQAKSLSLWSEAFFSSKLKTLMQSA